MTKHNHAVCFGKREENCPRCEELANGATPRSGWQKQYYATKIQQESSRHEAIRNHDFVACATKNVVCTHFDW